MKIFNRLCGFGTGLLLVAITAQADNNCLNFNDALALAAQTDPTVLTARAQRAEAEADLIEARSLFQPQISAFGRTGAGDVGVVNSAIQNQAGVRISQRLFDFGDAKHARTAANFNLKATAADIRQTQMASAQESGLFFLGIMEATEQLQATSERRDYFQRQLEAVDDLLAKGGATRSERADVAAQLGDAEASFLELQFQLNQASTRLAISTGVEFKICETNKLDNYFRTRMSVLPDSETAVSMTMSESPALKALERRATALKSERQREDINHLPVIDVVGLSSYTSGEDSSDYQLQNRIGIDVSVPLYSGSALKARKQQAAAREMAARSQILEAKRQLRERVSIIYWRIGSLEQQLLSRINVEEQNREQFTSAETEYSAGTRTLPELIDIRMDYEASSLERINIKFDLLQQRLQLLIFTALFPLTLQS
jgi:outer membrane protein TolC